MEKEIKEKEKCIKCGKRKKYDSDGLCSVCNYRKMLGIKT